MKRILFVVAAVILFNLIILVVQTRDSINRTATVQLDRAIDVKEEPLTGRLFFRFYEEVDLALSYGNSVNTVFSDWVVDIYEQTFIDNSLSRITFMRAFKKDSEKALWEYRDGRFILSPQSNAILLFSSQKSNRTNNDYPVFTTISNLDPETGKKPGKYPFLKEGIIPKRSFLKLGCYY